MVATPFYSFGCKQINWNGFFNVFIEDTQDQFLNNEETITGMLQYNTFMRKGDDSLASDRVELQCDGNEDGGNGIQPSLFGLCAHLSSFPL